MSGSGGGTRKLRLREAAVAAAVLVAGAGLVWCAVPMAAASLAEIPGNATLERLHRDVAGAGALRGLIRSREASLEWREKGRTWTDLALARILLGERGTDSKRDAQLARAEDALARGLGLSPMNPHVWMRLVLVRMMSERPAAEIAPPLGLALATGPHEDRMDALAVEAGLLCWSELDAQDRDSVARRVREAWRRDAPGTAAVATRLGRAPLLARLVGLGTPASDSAQ